MPCAPKRFGVHLCLHWLMVTRARTPRQRASAGAGARTVEAEQVAAGRRRHPAAAGARARRDGRAGLVEHQQLAAAAATVVDLPSRGAAEGSGEQMQSHTHRQPERDDVCVHDMCL